MNRVSGMANNRMFREFQSTGSSVSIVDLRSDTLTKPSSEMREAMLRAEVGDDVFEEDPTVKKLEMEAARLVGMQDSLFVCSGTMANLIAIMNHCDVRGCEAYCAETLHCLIHEQCGASQIGGVSLRPLRCNSDGTTFDVTELQRKLRKDRDHEPISRLVIVENATNGKVVPQNWIRDLVRFCKQRELKLHMDGARLWNASAASGVSANEIVSGFDSVSFCLSKGLGAPVGSLLCGNRRFVANCRRIRKVLGGGMRQVGVLAAAGLVALKNIPNLIEDHRRAAVIAAAINQTCSTLFSVDSDSVQTNMVFVKMNSSEINAATFAKHLRDVDDSDEEKIAVKCMALDEASVRLVLHSDVGDEDLGLAVKKITNVIRKLDNKRL